MNLVRSFERDLEEAYKAYFSAKGKLDKSKIRILEKVSDEEVLKQILEKPFLYILYVMTAERTKGMVGHQMHSSSSYVWCMPEDFREYFPGHWNVIERYRKLFISVPITNELDFILPGHTRIPLIKRETAFKIDGWDHYYESWIVSNHQFFAKRCLKLIKENLDEIAKTIEDDLMGRRKNEYCG